ncbi:MAG: ABC transporter permease, partial [Chloroflexota bacterium]
MRIWLIARKSLLEISREWQLLGLTLLLPVVFLGLTAAGYSASLSRTYPMLVYQGGAPVTGQAGLFESIASTRYPNDRPVFNVQPVGNLALAEAALQDNSAVALVTARTTDAGLPAVTVRGDALNPRFYRAGPLLDRVIYAYTDSLAGRPDTVRTALKPVTAAGPETEFDLYAPGMIVFALLLLIPQTAMLVAREIRQRTLNRLRLTPMRALDLLAGVGLAQMVVAGLQVLVVFTAALAMGFHNRGSVGLALVVGLAISLSAVGVGLAVACFVENDSQAANIGGTASMVQVFLS